MKGSILSSGAILMAMSLTACGGGAEAEDTKAKGTSVFERQIAAIGETQDAVDKINARSDPEAWVNGTSETPAPPEAPPVQAAPEPEQPRLQPRAAPPKPAEDPGRVNATEPDGNAVDPEDVKPAPETDPPPEPSLAIPAGAELELSMEEEVSTKTHVAGDVVWARVVSELLAADGMVLVPEGTRVRAVLSASAESPDDDTPAILVLDFEALHLPDGETLIQSQVMEADIQADEKDSDTETAAKVAVGAAAGALLGKIFGGDKEDAVKGGAVGAVAGTAVAIGTRGGHAKLDAGGRVVIRLLDAVRLIT